MKKNRKKILAGDIFRFPISQIDFGYGQVILSDIIQYIVVYELIMGDVFPYHEINSLEILLCGWTSDAKIYVGDWEIVERISPPTTIEFPVYKVGIAGETWITDVEGRALRRATSREARELPFKASHSPIAYEQAFKAHHGLGPWEPWFEQLLARRQSL
jgi:hypothetical protein